MSNIDYSKLSESTRIILNELSEEYKNTLILRSLDLNALSSLEDLSPRDIVLTDEKIKRNILIQNSKQERLTKLLKMTGILYMFFGLIIYFYLNIDFSNSPLQLASLLVSLVGVFIIMIAYFYNFLKVGKKYSSTKAIKETKYMNTYEMIHKWSEIEKLSIEILESKGIKSGEYIPVSRLIDGLIQFNVLDSEYKEDYRFVLHIRNSIVHVGMEDLTDEKIQEGLIKANKLLSKLKQV